MKQIEFAVGQMEAEYLSGPVFIRGMMLTIASDPEIPSGVER